MVELYKENDVCVYIYIMKIMTSNENYPLVALAWNHACAYCYTKLLKGINPHQQ